MSESKITSLFFFVIAKSFRSVLLFFVDMFRERTFWQLKLNFGNLTPSLSIIFGLGSTGFNSSLPTTGAIYFTGSDEPQAEFTYFLRI